MIAIIGAGISGLTSAITLQKLGHRVVLIDKGRSVGGRLATRYFESGGVKRHVDTASHYVELRDETPRFKRLLVSLFPEQAGAARLLGPAGINSVAKTLAERISPDDNEILTGHKVSAITYDAASEKFDITAAAMTTTAAGDGVEQKGRTIQVDGVILTAPVPQSIDLLEAFPDLITTLRPFARYRKSLLLLLWPKRATAAESLLREKRPACIDRIVLQSHIETNAAPVPIAVHATYGWSDRNYGHSDTDIRTALMEAVGIEEEDYDRVQVKRWVSRIKKKSMNY